MQWLLELDMIFMPLYITLHSYRNIKLSQAVFIPQEVLGFKRQPIPIEV